MKQGKPKPPSKQEWDEWAANEPRIKKPEKQDRKFPREK
jgi:hypothetical protein